jgi:hypothetical protein
MILWKTKTRHPRMPFYVLAAAQISFVLSNFLERFASAWLPGWVPVDFLCGMLLGFSLVGNLMFLILYGQMNRAKPGGMLR